MGRLIEPDRTQVTFLPRRLDEYVGPEHPARFVAAFVKAVLPRLRLVVPSGRRGEAAYGPELMLCIWVYGWMMNIRTLRKLEQACHDSFAFHYLTGGVRPDHNAIWRFFRDNKEALVGVFKQSIRVAADAQLIGLALHALDGTKMQAASSMDTAWHRKTLNEALKKLDQIIAEQIAQMEAQHQVEVQGFALPPELQDAQAQRTAIEAALQKLDAIDRDHLHPNEQDARVMKGRHGTVLGYNAQADVDEKSGLVVAAKVVNAEHDADQLIPMVTQATENVGATADQTVADAGYNKGEQLQQAKDQGLQVIVAQQKAKEAETTLYPKSQFAFDPERNVYVCPLGTDLVQISAPRPTTDPSTALTHYQCHNKACPVRAQCSKDERGRTIKRSPFDEARQENLERTKQPENADIQKRRATTVERHFGQTKWNDGFRRFTVRDLEKVDAQWLLQMGVQNLRKLYPHWLTGKLAGILRMQEVPMG